MGIIAFLNHFPQIGVGAKQLFRTSTRPLTEGLRPKIKAALAFGKFMLFDGVCCFAVLLGMNL